MDTALYTASGTASSRAEQAYAELKTRLLTGEFPLHVRLAECKLGSMIGVSRTPVREALARLHSEGLVSRGADGGFVPSVPDLSVMRDLYEVRIVLEVQALRRTMTSDGNEWRTSVSRLRDEWLALLEEPVEEADPTFVLLDESFHVGLAEASGNMVLASYLHHVNQRIRILRMQDFLSADRVQITITEHVAIAEAALSGALAEAELALTSHIDASTAVVERRLELAVMRMTLGAR